PWTPTRVGVLDLLSELDQGSGRAAAITLHGSAGAPRPSVEQPRHRGRLRYLADLRHQSGADRNAIAKAHLGQFPLGIAGHHHGLIRVDRQRGPERSEKTRHIGLEITGTPKDGWVNSQEEMPNVHADGFLGVFGICDERCARQAGPENIHHYREAVTL